MSEKKDAASSGVSVDRMEDVEEGRTEADRVGVFLWGLFGFAMPILAIPVVHLQSPIMPTHLIAACADADGYTELFERSYVEHLKARQVKAVWLGVACVAVLIIAGICGSALSTSFDALD